MITTPGTRLTWADLAGWIGAAYAIDRRRASSARHRAIDCHLAALQPALVMRCDDSETLRLALRLWKDNAAGGSFCRPPRGHRATALQTDLIVAAENRLAQLRRAEAAADIPAGPNWLAMHPEEATGCASR